MNARAPASDRSRHRAPGRVALWIACTLLAASLVAGIGVGALRVPPLQALSVLLAKCGLPAPAGFTAQQEAVLLYIRLPRVLVGALVGAALSMSGAALQGLFRNPLVEPGLIGVTAGASLAVAVAIVAGPALALSAFTPILLPVAAFGGALAVTLVVLRLGSAARSTDVALLLLAGIALNALGFAATGLLTFLANDGQLRDLTFWMLGGLGGATWSALCWVGPLLLLPLVLLPRESRGLNVLLLGENEARHLGVPVERLKKRLVALVALGAGAAVSIAGAIGFVGLVVPHIVRLRLGPDHRVLLPVAGVLGAALVVGADLIARTVAAPAELPIGVLTALVGAPFFLWLLLRARARARNP